MEAGNRKIGFLGSWWCLLLGGPAEPAEGIPAQRESHRHFTKPRILELPPKPRVPLPHMLAEWFCFHSSPQKHITRKQILVQESYREASFKGGNVL